jgi:subtilisin family serine protease
VITVAATYDRINLASFSNYGQTVDVAAPGVNILSSVPGNHYLRVSGTSQAAPYVANLAAKIKDANPELYPVQIKKILMGTVDKKDYLVGKVASQGIVNNDRAIYAASLTKEMSVEKAINQSKTAIADIAVNKSLVPTVVPFVLPLPSPFKL